MASISLELTGTLYRKMDTQRITDTLEKRDFVLETADDQYPQLIKFELINDRCKSIDQYLPGDKLKVMFNARGREWKKDNATSVFFVALQAWRLERVSADNDKNIPQTAAEAVAAEPVIHDDDLPF